MSPAIPTREVIAVAVNGNCLYGTYHKSSGGTAALRPGPHESHRVGVLFLNPGFLPRASPSAVYWADSFAKAGYPAFRFDLPGLGDSEGQIPAKMLEYVGSGGYAPVLSHIVRELAGRFGLSGVVIMGLCSGAVSALFTAAVAKECVGVVLMDPYFFLHQERMKIRNELSRWATWTRLGAIASEVYHRLRHMRQFFRGNRFPSNANLPLLRCWDQLTSAGVPILILKAPAVKASGLKPRVGEFDYIGYLQTSSNANSRVSIEFIEATNHSFADAAGILAVRQHTEEWLAGCFPLVGIGSDETAALDSRH
ncbi:MAG TPA: alpha/beta fold hydrolase [Bryobacteraceae bacterium]|nr:alpha/beta fold hydrolase [Bryobacteraceae bacterium]